jgi:hypothetical protein
MQALRMTLPISHMASCSNSETSSGVRSGSSMLLRMASALRSGNSRMALETNGPSKSMVTMLSSLNSEPIRTALTSWAWITSTKGADSSISSRTI